MASPVKTERLPASYRLRLREAGIKQREVAARSPEYHPEGREVTVVFINRVLNRATACPDWLHREFDEMLAEAEGRREDED